MADLTGVTWKKSSRSQGADNCVEVGRAPGVVGVRDTKNRAGGALALTPDQFAAFTGALKDGRLG